MSDLILGARIDPTWNHDSVEKDLSSASEEDLRYSYLLGDIDLRSGDTDLSAKWGWVPLLDFVPSLIYPSPATAHQAGRMVRVH
jgi:hypothetical protein